MFQVDGGNATCPNLFFWENQSEKNRESVRLVLAHESKKQKIIKQISRT